VPAGTLNRYAPVAEVTTFAISTPPREIVTDVFATGRLASFTTVPKRPVDEALAGTVPSAKTATIRIERRRPKVFIDKYYDGHPKYSRKSDIHGAKIHKIRDKLLNVSLWERPKQRKSSSREK
jgi:hypothetical protein